MSIKRRGVVVRWGERGFGFIRETEPDAGKEYFCHIESVIGRVALATGLQVEFELAAFESKRGAPQAVFVTPLPLPVNGGAR
jgi:cold shock CspA family protein